MMLNQPTEQSAILISIIPSLLWFIFAVGLIALFWKMIRKVLDALATRIQAGAPLIMGPLNIGAPPPGLGTDEAKGATAEGIKGVKVPIDIEKTLTERHYPEQLADDIYLVHQSKVLRSYRGPKTGLWLVRVYIEAYDDETALDEITRVTYRLHDTFRKKVIATEARSGAFELWIKIYGEFNLIAYVERKNKPALWLTRYIDLPGRPTN